MPDNTLVDNQMRAKIGLPPQGTQTAVSVPAPTPVPNQPAPVADQTAALAAEIAEMRQDMVTYQQENLHNQNVISNLQSDLVTLRGKQEEQRLQLPTDEELEDLPRGEAIRKMAEAIADTKIAEQNRMFMPAMHQLVGDFVALKNESEERQVKEVFPNLNIEKYRVQLDQKRIDYPKATTNELLRLIADPVDLMPTAQSTTPNEGVHMETGLPTGTQTHIGSREVASQEAALKEGIDAARLAGNKSQSRALMMELLKLRPDVPASASGG